jgi:hypothetical protein
VIIAGTTYVLHNGFVMPYKDPPKAQITWPQATVIIALALMLMTSVTVLALNNKDVSAILSAVGGIILVVGGLFGFSLHNKVDRVETMTNGRLTEQIEANQKLQDQVRSLALLVTPPPLPEPPSQTPDTVAPQSPPGAVPATVQTP